VFCNLDDIEIAARIIRGRTARRLVGVWGAPETVASHVASEEPHPRSPRWVTPPRRGVTGTGSLCR